MRGSGYEALRQHDKAIADFTRCLERDPKRSDAYDHRGSEHFILGHIKESLDDFDKFLALQPKAAPGHWKRGIALYYAGRYEEGRKQFKDGDKFSPTMSRTPSGISSVTPRSKESTPRGKTCSRSARTTECP